MEKVFEINDKRFFDMGFMPDPPNMEYALNIDYDPSDEEKFDETKHLGKFMKVVLESKFDFCNFLIWRSFMVLTTRTKNPNSDIFKPGCILNILPIGWIIPAELGQPVSPQQSECP